MIGRCSRKFPKNRCCECKKRLGFGSICPDCFDNLPRIRMQVERRERIPLSIDAPCSTAPRLLEKGSPFSIIVYPLGNCLLIRKVESRFLHTEPCLRCKDHPRTVISAFNSQIV